MTSAIAHLAEDLLLVARGAAERDAVARAGSRSPARSSSRPPSPRPRRGPARWPRPRPCACRPGAGSAPGPCPCVMVAIWSSGTIMLLPRDRDRQVLDVARRRRGRRDAGAPRRRASRPSGSTQSPTSTPAKATRSACAASPTEMPSWLASPRSSSILQLVLRLLLREAHVHRARDLLHLLHEVVGDRHEAARVGAGELDLHGLAHAVVEVVEHDVLGADQALQERRAGRAAISKAERLRSLLLPMST